MQAANAFGWGYYNKQLGVDHKKYFPGEKRTAAQGLAFIKDYPQAAPLIDTGIIQANASNVKQYGLKNSGPVADQVTSLAKHISNQTAKHPEFKRLVDEGKFKEAEAWKIPGKPSGRNHPIPAYNLDVEARLSAGAKDAFQTNLMANYNGDACAMLADYNSKIPPTPSIQEMMGSDYVAPDIPIDSNQPITQTPTPHHGVSGPNTNNQALGMFGYASEGQAVWVFFREGNPLFPVYFAASYGSKEWGGIYQNASNAFGSGTPGTEKMAFNLYGGGFTSSTSTEESPQGAASSFQLYDRNGSNLTFANDHTQFNSMYNHVHRVLGDHHDITETNKEVRVRGNYNTFTEQDMFITIGNWTKEAMDASDELQEIINEAMEAKSKTS
jgi:hypothetical protein